jgi:hypothetical protein
VRRGLAAADVSAALPSDRPVQEPITARALYGAGPTGDAAVWVVLDFLDFGPDFVDAIKGAVRARTGLAEGHVHVVTTHNHSVLGAARFDLDALCTGAADAAAEARDRAQPAMMRWASVNVTERLNYKRRLFVDELQGAVTFWYGITPAQGYRADGLLRQVVRALVKDRRIIYADSGYSQPVSEEAFVNERLRRDPDCYVMPPGDPTLQAVLFENERGEAIGSLARYAVHVHACKRDGPYSSDFPHYVRRALEDAFGGCAIFLNGPCANISPVTGLGAGPDERTCGGLLGSRAVAALEAARPEPLTAFADATRDVTLPVRDDFPFEDAARDREVGRVRSLLEQHNLGLAERKRLAERLFWLGQTATMRDVWRCVDRRDSVLQPTVTVSLGLLRLGALSILAFPGETFWETGVEATAGLDASRIITVTEHGRTGVYLPPPSEWPLGGYESSCCVIAQDAEPLLCRSAADLLRPLT